MENFTWVDGTIVGVYILATMIAGLAVRKYVGKVEHFLLAGREMNIYLGVASLAATEFGIVTCMYTAQQGYKYGFAGAMPGILNAIMMLLVGLSGFCVSKLRDSGVTTIPELYEKRFGSKIRWLSGVVIVLGGLLNMGVFLKVGGEFLVIVCGFDPNHLKMAMTALLIAVSLYTILGGMLSVLVTDYLQFIVMSVGLIAVTILILVRVGWGTIMASIETNIGPGAFNPFVNPDLGAPFVIYYAMHQLAVVLTWQTTIQRLLAAKDTKTGLKIYTRTSFFFVCRFMIPGLWGMAALAVLGPALAGENTLHAMPLFLSRFVPMGLMGILVAAMLAADMSTDSAYMLTWGSVIYNDILGPFRKSKWSEKRGILWNRMIVALIGIFLLVYGLWYPLKDNLWDYLAITGTIYLSSMSVLLISCCYWKRANNWGATGAIIMGAIIPIAFLVSQQIGTTETLAKTIGVPTSQMPYYSGIATYALAWMAMIGGSLLKPQHQHVLEEAKAL